MINALWRKQLLELTAGIRMGRERGRLRKPGTLFFIGLLFLYLLVMLLGLFGFVSKQIVTALLEQELGWLYFAVMGLIALSVGVLCTALTASSSLFQARDNELLLSLPIPPRKILLVRMLGIYLTGLFAVGIVYIPAALVYLGTSHQYSAFFSQLVFFALLGLLVLGINCLLGWLISLLSSRVAHKSLLCVLLSLVFLVAYYGLYSNMDQLVSRFLTESVAIGNSLRAAAYPLYVLGMAGTGNGACLAQLGAVVAALLFPVWLLMERSFFRLASSHRAQSPRLRCAQTRVGAAHRPKTALIQNEWRRLTASSNYMLNCGLGLILTVAMGLSLLLKPETAQALFLSIAAYFPDVNTKSALMLGTVTALCLSMCDTAAASISLEGKNLWILKSLPVRPQEILCAKADLQLFLCLLPGAFLLSVFYCTADIALTQCLLAGGYVLLLTRFLSYVDVIWNILFPNLNWTNEVAAVKQSLSVIIALLGNMLIVLLLLLLYVKLCPYLGEALLSAVLPALIAAAGLSARFWLRRTGTRLWSDL